MNARRIFLVFSRRGAKGLLLDNVSGLSYFQLALCWFTVYYHLTFENWYRLHLTMNRQAKKWKNAEAPFRVLAFFSPVIHRGVNGSEFSNVT